MPKRQRNLLDNDTQNLGQLMQFYQYLINSYKEIFLIENPLPHSQIGKCILLDFYILVHVLEKSKISTVTVI